MPIVLAAAALCLAPTVHDGDTIRCGRERVRIANEASRVALTRLLSRGRVMITRLGTDPYGRTLATVSVNGVDAGDYLVAQGLARPWR